MPKDKKLKYSSSSAQSNTDSTDSEPEMLEKQKDVEEEEEEKEQKIAKFTPKKRGLKRKHSSPNFQISPSSSYGQQEKLWRLVRHKYILTNPANVVKNTFLRRVRKLSVFLVVRSK